MYDTLASIVSMENGKAVFHPQPKFKYTDVVGGNRTIRMLVFSTIANATREQLEAQPFECRAKLFQVLVQEGRRYSGTAHRKGNPAEALPRLRFNSGAEALGYKDALERAIQSLKRLFPDSPKVEQLAKPDDPPAAAIA